MRLESETYVLLSDASKALLLVNKGDVDMLDLRVVNVFEHDNPPSRELGKRPAGAFSDAGWREDLHGGSRLA